jgi:hypothetical protein
MLHGPLRPSPQASSEIADDIQLHSLMSKVALLCLHFPRLRIIWSRSLHATAGGCWLRCRPCTSAGAAPQLFARLQPGARLLPGHLSLVLLECTP